MKATLLHDERKVYAEGRYIAYVKVYGVEKSSKYPDGIKARFALVDSEGATHLLVDNHEPFGFHIHTRLPRDKKHRTRIEAINYSEAMDLFFDEVRRIISEDNT